MRQADVGIGPYGWERVSARVLRRDMFRADGAERADNIHSYGRCRNRKRPPGRSPEAFLFRL